MVTVTWIFQLVHVETVVANFLSTGTWSGGTL